MRVRSRNHRRLGGARELTGCVSPKIPPNFQTLSLGLPPLRLPQNLPLSLPLHRSTTLFWSPSSTATSTGSATFPTSALLQQVRHRRQPPTCPRPLLARSPIASNDLSRLVDIMTLCALQSPKQRPLHFPAPSESSCYSSHPHPHTQLQLSPPPPTVVEPLLSLEPHPRQGQDSETHRRRRSTAGKRRSIRHIRPTPRHITRER